MNEDQTTNQILDADFEKPSATRRRKLLPWWIRFFCWVFMIFGAFAPLGLVAGLVGINYQVSLYGLETYQPMSLIGFGLIILFIIKGAAAFGLWTEKDWAINVAYLDAVAGILVCIFVMTVYPMIDSSSGSGINFRLELLLLIPYLIKLNKINTDWKNLE